MKLLLLIVSVIAMTSLTYAQNHNIGNGNLTTCSRTLFDTGGNGGSYSSSENIVETYCSNAGNCVSINFTAFNTESGFDELSIYDGANTSATLIGTFSGTTSPGTITSTTGCLTFEWSSDGSVTDSGWRASLSCVACPVPTCSDGIQNGTETGIDCGGTCPACPSGQNIGSGNLSSCSGSLFDSGGSGGNYSNNELITETYCSDAGDCISIAFSSFSTESGWDDLTIYDGNSTAGTLIGVYDGTNSPGTVTSTSGCLTFVWDSDGSTNDSGWEATISCAACPAPTCSDGIQNGTETGIDCGGTCPPCPVAPLNDECAGAFPLTVNPDLNCGSTTAGTVELATASAQDAGACFGTEDDDVWFSFVAVETTHTIDILNAAGSTTDMYHSVWTGNCATTLFAGSCSDADASTLTGLTVGETYYIRVYTWTGTTGQTSTFDVCVGTLPPPGPCIADLTINSTTASISNTTCGFGDDYDSGDACGSSYMDGDDIVIEYNPTTTGCVDLALTNTDTWTGIFVTDGCPDDPGTSCLSSNTNSGGNPSIDDFSVVAGTSYYITISTFPTPQCTAFDLDITDCPPPTCTDGIQNGTETGIDCGGTCGPCPPASAEDCAGGTTVCTDAVISGNSAGDGDVSDLVAANSGCLGIEHESSWYYFQAATDGDIELTITTTVDYDFAIWGPYPGAIACPPVGAPLRCSFGATAGNTGLAIGSGDTSEGTGGDEFVDEINATAGDSFIMLIDNFTSDGTNFTLDWTLSSGATLDCTLLPVTFSDFHITKMENSNLLNWNTYSESNNSYFKIQILESDNEFYTIGTLNGQNNSSEITPYVFNHYRPEKRVNTYRIIQVDNDGKETIYTPKTVDNTEETSEIIGTFNLLGQEVGEDYIGIVIRVHADGTTTKSYQNNQ